MYRQVSLNLSKQTNIEISAYFTVMRHFYDKCQTCINNMTFHIYPCEKILFSMF
jgi:hypothetical protein